jgi:anti-sigma factor RsiW
MACDDWKAKLDDYLDGELPSEEMHAFDAHVRTCQFCAAEAFAGLQLKRSVQSAGKRFTPSAEFRQRMQKSIAAKPPRRFFGFGWMTAATVAAMLAIMAIALTYRSTQRSRTDEAYSELADLHVSTLASSSPVDVLSTDRHTVKPWFQGKIPFAFDLPELQHSEFSLLGGRVTYLEQSPGAHLIYELRKHRISVFVFPEDSVHGRLDERSLAKKERSFNMETWSQGGLRYVVIGDASPSDIYDLARLFKLTT